MITKYFLAGETVVIQCESCEPEVAVVVCKGPVCSDCSNQTYRLQTAEASLLVECCASILHPLN